MNMLSGMVVLPNMGPNSEQLLSVVHRVLSPLIEADGGELYFVALEGRKVSLHLGGRFSGCPGNDAVLEHVLLPPLRAQWPEIEITLSSGPLVPAGAIRLRPELPAPTS